VLEDASGAVWVGTSTSGLFRFDGRRFENVAISHREVFNITEDRENNLWVGTSGGGLNQVQPRAIRVEGEETGVPFRAVQAICEDRDGRLWAVTQDGTFVTRVNGSWQNVLPGGESLNAEASCIAADPSGAIWIGTRNHRLFRWRAGRVDSWGAAEGLACSTVRALVISTSGDLWIGGSGPAALQRFHNGKLQTFSLPAGTRAINAVAEDAAQNIWAGGAGSGLIRVNFRGEPSLENPTADAQKFHIRALHTTPDGSLWISYDQGGVGRLKAGAYKRITTKEGLVDDNLRLVISDQHGWLWFAAVSHLFKVRQSQLDDVAEGRATRLQAVRYGREQGLHVVLGGSVGALLSREGRLWLPLATSLAVIDPELQDKSRPPPAVFVTQVAVDDDALASYGGPLPPPRGADIRQASLRLGPAHRRLNLDFTAPSFSAPDSIRFHYRLENFDDTWIEAGAERRATYSRLAAGKYRFQVKASSTDGAWGETGTSLDFEVTPFFWETWWFRSAAVAVFTALIFLVARFLSHRRLRLKVRSLEQQTALERERSRIARDIHDDLGSRLTKIVLLSGLAKREAAGPENSVARIDEISDTARQLMKSLDETVWLVSPRNDTLPHLVSYLSQYAVTFLRTAEIACHVDLPDDPPDCIVPSDMRHNLLLALKEALNNIVRHAHATLAHLRISVEKEKLLIEISDNGRGFNHAANDDGADGLINMQQRMKQIGGEFSVTSEPGAGTRVALIATCPVRKG
jgi:signal transduction histidine kinase/streptogramin lyase